jgi:hypothetical protein
MVISGIRSIGTYAPVAAASLGLITLNEEGVAIAANGVALSATEM